MDGTCCPLGQVWVSFVLLGDLTPPSRNSDWVLTKNPTPFPHGHTRDLAALCRGLQGCAGNTPPTVRL